MSMENLEKFPKIFAPEEEHKEVPRISGSEEMGDSRQESEFLPKEKELEDMFARKKYAELIDRVAWHEYGERLKDAEKQESEMRKKREESETVDSDAQFDINLTMKLLASDESSLVRFMRELDKEERVGQLLKPFEDYYPHARQWKNAAMWLGALREFYDECDRVLKERELKIPPGEWNKYVMESYDKWEKYKKTQVLPEAKEEAERRIGFLREAERRVNRHIRRAA